MMLERLHRRQNRRKTIAATTTGAAGVGMSGSPRDPVGEHRISVGLGGDEDHRWALVLSVDEWAELSARVETVLARRRAALAPRRAA